MVAAVFGCVHNSPSERTPSSIGGAKALTDDQIFKASSSGKLDVKEGWVVTDNDAAFASKIQALRNTTAGSEIRMIYFIYSSDASSSYFTNEVIKAAKRGVKVKILVDFLTNFKNYTLFRMMQQEGAGNIEVRMYGVPTENMLKTAKFLTMACPEEKPESRNDCLNYKKGLINLGESHEGRPVDDFYARLFMSGLAAKDPNALKMSMILGTQIELEKYKKMKTSMSKEDLIDLKQFFVWTADAALNHDISSMLKIQMALSTEGELLNPILNEITGRIPSDLFNKDWEHLSDYTHHKLLLIDDTFFQLGGRNIENSYHMKRNELSAKYTFMDTEFVGILNSRSSGAQIKSSFEKMWNFTPMVKGLDQLDSYFGFSDQNRPIVFQPKEIKENLWACINQSPNLSLKEITKIKDDIRTRMYQCLNNRNSLKSVSELVLLRKSELNSNIGIYVEKYLNKSENQETRNLLENQGNNFSWLENGKFGFTLSSADKQNMLMTFVENLHFNKEDPSKRVMGAITSKWQYESDLSYGKGIHELWLKGLENTCAVSAIDGVPRRVILHSAYFLPPAKMMTTFGKMVNGTWDCHNVHVTFLTNSIETSDLNIINIYAKYQMVGFFDVLRNILNSNGTGYSIEAKTKAAKFDFFEYKQPSPDPTKRVSLHTKLTVLGDDIIIGSANADVRSYYMDTNDAVYLKNAKGLIKEYVAMIDSILTDEGKTKNLSDSYSDNKKALKLEDLRLEDEKFLKYTADHYHVTLKESTIREIMAEHRKVSSGIIRITQKIFQPQAFITTGGTEIFEKEQAIQKELEDIQYRFNRSLQIF